MHLFDLIQCSLIGVNSHSFNIFAFALIIDLFALSGMPPMGRGAGAMPPQMRPPMMSRAPPPGGRGGAF